ncbi:MAG: hypothetical protein M1820_008922 [Bogoriella megaspora]|nr:MAG: hypothetical protein M1820_008922 [Bogoriella megaspora]
MALMTSSLSTANFNTSINRTNTIPSTTAQQSQKANERSSSRPLGQYIAQGLQPWSSSQEPTSAMTSTRVNPSISTEGYDNGSITDLVESYKTKQEARTSNSSSATILTTQTPIDTSKTSPIGYDGNGTMISTGSVRLSNNSGLNSAQSCWDDWDAYYYSSSANLCETYTTVLDREKDVDFGMEDVYNTYKLCDGWPRARAIASPSWSITTWSLQGQSIGPWSSEMTTETSNDDWRLLFQLYDSLPINQGCVDLRIDSTVTPTATGLVEVTTLGTTLTSGTAYISYPAYSAVGYFQSVTQGQASGLCGSAIPAGILALPSSEVSSLRGEWVWHTEVVATTPYSMNFADLWPNPVPSYPSALINKDPRWATCFLDLMALQDPPHALSVQSAAASPDPSPMPTVPADPSPIPGQDLSKPPSNPSPGSRVSSPLPIPTNAHTSDSTGPSENPSPAKSVSQTHPLSLSDGENHVSGSGSAPNPGSYDPGTHPSSEDASRRLDPTQDAAFSHPSAAPVSSQPSAGAMISINRGGGADSEADSAQSKTITDPEQSRPNTANLAQDTDPNTGKFSSAGIWDATKGDPEADAIGAVPTYSRPAPKDPQGHVSDRQARKLTSRSDGNLVIGSRTLSPGDTATVLGQNVHYLGNAGVVVDGQTRALVDSNAAREALITLGSATLTAVETRVPDGSNSVVVVGGSTLTDGGAAITMGSKILSLNSGSLVVADGDRKATLGFSATVVGATRPEAPLTLGSQKATAFEEFDPSISSSIAVIISLTLTMGGQVITTDGQTISLGSAGLVAVFGGTTQTVPFGTDASRDPAGTALAEAVVTLGSSTMTAIESTASDGSQIVVLGSKTFTVGGSPITIDGEAISAETAGLVVVSGGQTETIPYSSASSTKSTLGSNQGAYPSGTVGPGGSPIAADAGVANSRADRVIPLLSRITVFLAAML